MAIIVGIGFVVFVLSRWGPREAVTWSFWSGNGQVTPLGFIGSIFTGTVAIASIAVLFWRTSINDQEHKASLKAGLADRFKTGSELLASPEPVTNASGLIVLKELASEEAQLYGATVANLLVAYVNLKGHDAFQRFFAYGRDENGELPLPVLDTAPIYMNALRAIGDLRKAQPLVWEATAGRAAGDSGFRETVLVGLVERGDFRDMRFSGIQVSGTVFSRCDLRSARFFATYFRDAIFRACNMDSAAINLTRRRSSNRLRLENCSLVKAQIFADSLTLRLDECDLDGATISVARLDLGYKCFAFSRPNLRAEVIDEEFRVYDANGPGTWKIRLGMRFFDPAHDCPFWTYEPNEQDDDHIPF